MSALEFLPRWRAGSRNGFADRCPRTCVHGTSASRGSCRRIHRSRRASSSRESDAHQLAHELLELSQEKFSAAFKGSPMKRAKLRDSSATRRWCSGTASSAGREPPQLIRHPSQKVWQARAPQARLSGMTTKRFNEDEAAEIFRRAAELEQRQPQLMAPRDGMTLAELQEIGREAGARSRPRRLAPRRSRQKRAPCRSVGVLGLPVGVGHSVELDRALSDAEWSGSSSTCARRSMRGA